MDTEAAHQQFRPDRHLSADALSQPDYRTANNRRQKCGAVYRSSCPCGPKLLIKCRYHHL